MELLVIINVSLELTLESHDSTSCAGNSIFGIIEAAAVNIVNIVTDS